ncbi:hypothetical protein JIQ42_05070 [Leishmania sp. Namibia]|uniref:hypothetical protein n=1 Tax=Leishmania sp. Namibia TaxID=2802991 RepID=UPI001B7A20F6|nr:hypothetical protein JIQ42_05070 [Leishmania sp. Namibia]
MSKPEQEDQEAVGAPQPVSPRTFERLMAESEERWQNRPRSVPLEGAGDFKIMEPRVCRLPFGGVSPSLKAQMERNRARLEAEKREKEQLENQQHAQNTEL